MADLIERTARQVRLPGGVPHRLKGQPYTVPQLGQHYRTGCGTTLTGQAGAMLTTHTATCTGCKNAKTVAAQLVEAAT